MSLCAITQLNRKAMFLWVVALEQSRISQCHLNKCSKVKRGIGLSKHVYCKTSHGGYHRIYRQSNSWGSQVGWVILKLSVLHSQDMACSPNVVHCDLTTRKAQCGVASSDAMPSEKNRAEHKLSDSQKWKQLLFT